MSDWNDRPDHEWTSTSLVAASHEHLVPEGEDTCERCGAICCPDCGAEVTYDDGEYRHPQPVCWLYRHQAMVDDETALLCVKVAIDHHRLGLSSADEALAQVARLVAGVTPPPVKESR